MNRTVKNLIVTALIGILIFIIGNIISGGFDFKSVNDFLIDFAFYQLYTFVLAYSNMYFFNYLEKIKWTNYLGIKRIVIGLSGSVIITLIGLIFLDALTAMLFKKDSFEEFTANISFDRYQFGLWITLIIMVVFHAIYFYNHYQQKKIKEQKVIAGTASAKFDALKNQLDPHFLFNSLNVLTSLIDENPKSAQKFTTALSKVYRYVLEQKNKDLVTVDEELDFAKTYMSLLKMRFEDSIIFDIPERASDPESKVVPLSLQLLLENAVKHNMVNTANPLHIKIYESHGNLIVENNLQPKQIVKKSSGVGLSNIKERYQLLTERKLNINQEAKKFAVAIPMLTKQVSIMRTQSNDRINDNYIRARKHVQELKEFYYSLASYCVVIPFLIFINWYTSWHFQWFWFPLFGWGLGLSIHAYKLFVNDGFFGRSWEQKKIQEFMKEDKEKNRWN